MTEPDPRAQPAVTYFDGRSSRRRAVELEFGDTLDIVENGTAVASWKYDDIRRADGHVDTLRVSSIGAPELARLEIRDGELAKLLTARTPMLDKGHNERSSTFKIVGWSLAAAVSIVLVAVYGVPYAAEQVTPIIPYSLEKKFGDAAQKQFRNIFDEKTCENAAGKAALDKLLTQVRRAGGLETEVSSVVIASPVPNAVALPGGFTFIFKGLLDRAETPDELAGVVGHELGHVAHRDHLRGMITSGGSSFLIGLLFGDVTGAGAAIFAATTIFNASHSRDAETSADGFAIEVMHRLGRSPKGLGELLTRLSGKAGGFEPKLLSSHPVTADRLARMTKEDRPPTGPDLLTGAEWTALKGICG